MNVFRAIPELDAAIGGAGKDYGKFAEESDESS
jgi:hypothetical protein